MSTYEIHLGNNLDILPTLPDNSVDSIVTDPPYELGFMGKSWDSSGIAYSVELWTQCLRVLKPGGHLLAFGGSRTWHRLAVAIEDSGFQLRDSIAWLYGSGFPKSLNLKGEWEGWGTALKPAFEPIVVARKPLIGTVSENILTYGTGALNIDGSRIGTEQRTNNATGKRSGSVTAGVSHNGESGGYNYASDNGSTTVQGRWPANVILDPYTAELLDEQSGISKSNLTIRSAKSTGRSGGIMGEVVARSDVGEPMGHNDSGGASRFFYVAKASKRDRNEGLEELEDSAPLAGRSGVTGNSFTLHISDSKNPVKNFHPTVKPTDLMRYLIKLVTPPDGVVLDPFTGSGSTGKAAILEGFDFIGIELTEEYLPIINGRLSHAQQQATKAQSKKDEELF